MHPLEVTTDTPKTTTNTITRSKDHHRHNHHGHTNRGRAESVEDEEFDEAWGLLDHELSAGHHTFEEETSQGRSHSIRSWAWWIVTMIVVLLWSHYWVGASPDEGEEKEEDIIIMDATKHPSSFDNNNNKNSIQQFYDYTCPTTMVVPDDLKQVPWEERQDEAILLELLTNALEDTNGEEVFRSQTLPTQTFASWNHFTYQQVHDMTLDWKQQQLASHLDFDEHDNINILVSTRGGMGVLHWYMTMEMIQQYSSQNNKNIVMHVYGNHCRDQSTQFTQQLLQVLDDSPLGHEYATLQSGMFCTADGTDLSYIMNNNNKSKNRQQPPMFDVVFSGYVTPLMDPLHLFTEQLSKPDYYETTTGTSSSSSISDHEQEVEGRIRQTYWQLCASNDIRDRTMAQRAQDKQESFFFLWIQEMIRVAKPGAIIIMESVPVPMCHNDNNDNEEPSKTTTATTSAKNSTANNYHWGGVSQEWWESTIKEQQKQQKNKSPWGDIDPSSLYFEKDHVFLDDGRYHVVMRKKKEKNEP